MFCFRWFNSSSITVTIYHFIESQEPGGFWHKSMKGIERMDQDGPGWTASTSEGGDGKGPFFDSYIKPTDYVKQTSEVTVWSRKAVRLLLRLPIRMPSFWSFDSWTQWVCKSIPISGCLIQHHLQHLHEHKQSRYLLSRSTYLRESFQPTWFFWSSLGYVPSPPQAGPARHFFHHRSCGWSSCGENVVSAEYDVVQKWNTHTWYHLICHWFSHWLTLSQLRICMNWPFWGMPYILCFDILIVSHCHASYPMNTRLQG